MAVCWETTLPFPTSPLDPSNQPPSHAWPTKGLALPGLKFEIHRTKGLISLEGSQKVILQGVREVFELSDPVSDDGGNEEGVVRTRKIVVIGRGLRRELWQASLDAVLGS